MIAELQKKLEELNIPTDYFSLLDWFEKRGLLIFLVKKVNKNDYLWKAIIEINPRWKDNHDINWWNIHNLNIPNRCNGENRQDAIDEMVKELLNIIPMKFLEDYE